jgi:5-formyltetrahydrofolate cyclo-ligase
MAGPNKIQRQQLRSQFRQKRGELTSAQQLSSAKNLLATCLTASNLAHVNTHNVACYLSNDCEINPKAIIEYCWQHKKRLLLPVLHPFSKGHLLFIDYCLNTKLKVNAYGISEPVVTSQNVCPLADIDVIFMPLVAFDSQGNRLGMGGGYYDRTLAPIRRDGLTTQLIGLAHDCQQADSLPTDSWDIPLNGIVTPTQYFDINA